MYNSVAFSVFGVVAINFGIFSCPFTTPISCGTGPPFVSLGHFVNMESHSVRPFVASLPEHHDFRVHPWVAGVRASLLSVADDVPLSGQTTLLFIRSSADGHLGCFWFLAVVSTAINSHAQVFVWTCVPTALGWMSGSEVCWAISRNGHCFQSGCPSGLRLLHISHLLSLFLVKSYRKHSHL